MEDWHALAQQGPMTASQLGNLGVSKVAPMATTFTQQNNMGSLQAQRVTAPTASSSVLGKLGDWVGNFVGQSESTIGTLAKGLVDGVVQGVEAVPAFAGNLVTEANLNGQIDATNKQLTSLNSQVSKLASDYRSGTITQQQYKDGLNALNGQFNDLTKTAQQNAKSATDNASATAKNAITTAEDVVAVVAAVATDGLSAVAVDGAEAAGDGSAAGIINFFGQREVSANMFSAAQKIDGIVQKTIDVTNFVPTLNGRLAAGTIAKITNETLGNVGTQMTAQKIGTNVAVNLLLKRPLIYQTNVDLASNIYTSMAKGDIGGAALSTVLTATMALSGGPIGAAIEALGKGGDVLKAAMFPKGGIADFMKNENKLVTKTGEGVLFSQEMIDKAAQQSVSRQSFDDVLSTFVGTGDKSQGAMTLAHLATQGEDGKALVKLWQVTAETNMRMAGGNAVVAAGYIRDFFNSLDDGKFLGSASYEDVIRHGAQWAADREGAIQSAIKDGGMSVADAQRIVIGRANQSDKELIMKIVSKADEQFGGITREGGATGLDFEKASELITLRKQLFLDAVDRYGRTAAWANSDTFQKEILKAINNNPRTEDMLKAIQSIKAGKELDGVVSDDVRKSLAAHGHIAIMPSVTKTPYVSLEDVASKGIKTGVKLAPTAKNAATLFEHAVQPVPILQTFGTLLTRAGLSPEASSAMVQKHFEANFAESIAQQSIKLGGNLGEMDGSAALVRIKAFVKETNETQKFHAPITDLRQMSIPELKAALDSPGAHLTSAEARAVAGSLNSAMLRVPYQIRGLGDRIQDVNLSLPFGARQFSRLQGASRFVFNPFFRWQQSTQTEGLAQLEAHAATGTFKTPQVILPHYGLYDRLFPKQSQELEDTINTLKEHQIFSSGFTGAGASPDMQGKIGTRIIETEKRSLAGLVNKLSANQGYATVEDYVRNNEPQVIDLLRTLTTSNHTQGVLDSPLVRSINMAFFPFRYNMKIAGMMANYMAKLDAPVQTAMLYSLYNFNNWLRSDEGISWQSTHAKAIDMFQWLSPTYPLNYVMQLGNDVIHPGEASISDFGILGGLPFGMISQFLDSAGVTHTQAPAIDITTGKPYPKYLPQNTAAVVNLAVQDLINSMFSYPGAKLGLPSKGSIVRGATSILPGGARSDTAPVDQSSQLTPFQQHESQVIQNNLGTTPGVTPQAAAPDAGVTTIPQPAINAPPRATTSSTRTRKLKKSQIRPAPLP